MDKLVVATFKDNKDASKIVETLKSKEFTSRISVIVKDKKQDYIDPETNKIKDKSNELQEATSSGGVLGSLLGFFVGASALTITGGVTVIGPVAAVLLGAAGGASLGALSEMLEEHNIEKSRIKSVLKRIDVGEIAVFILVDEEDIESAKEILNTNKVEYFEEYK